MNEPERTQEKKAWQKPELIVLVRSRPEEMVLEVCKVQSGWVGGGPGDDNSLCDFGCAAWCSGDAAS